MRADAAKWGGIIKGLGIAPTPATSEHGMVGRDVWGWNYTTVLDVVALVAFAGIYWLYRHRARYGRSIFGDLIRIVILHFSNSFQSETVTLRNVAGIRVPSSVLLLCAFARASS